MTEIEPTGAPRPDSMHETDEFRATLRTPVAALVQIATREVHSGTDYSMLLQVEPKPATHARQLRLVSSQPPLEYSSKVYLNTTEIQVGKEVGLTGSELRDLSFKVHGISSNAEQ
jgi:hypothetical protein